MSAEEVAKAFVNHYYQAFDSNVGSLASLYVSYNAESDIILCLEHWRSSWQMGLVCWKDTTGHWNSGYRPCMCLIVVLR